MSKVYEAAHLFHGTEADSEAPMITIGMPRSYCEDRRRVPSAERFFVDDAVPEPASDDQRDEWANWPTTRRYPRTMHGVDSAWPKDPEYTDPIERFARSSFEQDKQAESLSHKWAHRCIYVIGTGVAIAYALGAFK